MECDSNGGSRFRQAPIAGPRRFSGRGMWSLNPGRRCGGRAHVLDGRACIMRAGPRQARGHSGRGPGMLNGIITRNGHSASAGRVLEQHVEDNHRSGTWRASFEVEPEPGAREVELRAFLRAGADTLTETWSYAWQIE